MITENRGRSFIAIMVIIALSALLLRVALEKVLVITCAQNEASAQATLKAMAAALDNYARDHKEAYPKSITTLIKYEPAYLDRDYMAESPMKGYIYNCARLDESGYSCYAFPQRCGLTGNLSFTVTTGNLLVSENCREKD
ncbi:MAG: type II secretion system protein [Candidatus Omnitrophota bacterium]|jgi:Tfp pilus assembly protein PilE